MIKPEEAEWIQRNINTLAGLTVHEALIKKRVSEFVLPQGRQFWSGIRNNLVSVQPMNMPSGLVFYMDHVYGTNKNGDTFNGKH